MVIIREITADSGIIDLTNELLINPILLTPGPKDADIIREINQQLLFEKKIDPITMSNFTTGMIETLCKNDLFPTEFKPKVFKKSEIYLNLSGVWEEIFGEGKDELFFQAYRTLSEIRGNSIDLNLISESLNLLNLELAKAVQVMWHFMDQQGLVDEHRAYKIIAENARSLKIEHDSIIVIGFNHLSAVQVDMFNELSKHVKVYVYLPKGLIQHLTRFDWPTWLEGFEQAKLNFAKQDKVDLIQFHNVILYPRNRLSETMLKKEESNIIFLNENILPEDFFEIPFSSFDLRSDHELFIGSINKLFDDIPKEITDIEDLKIYLKDRTKNLLISQFDNEHNFIELKVTHLLYKSLVNLEMEFISNKKKLTSFLFRVLKNVCCLDAPRSSIVNFSNDCNSKNNVMSIADSRFKKFQTVDLIIRKEDLPFSLSFDSSNRELVSFLSTIGPIKNTSLNNKMNLTWLVNSLKAVPEKNITVFIEDGCFELGDELFSFLGIKNANIAYKKSKVSIKDDLLRGYNSEVGKFSATKLQCFVDCPKKFEEIYLFKNKNYPKLKETMLPNQLGLLEHQAIEYFYKKIDRPINLEMIKELSKELLNKYLIQNAISLNEINFLTILNEIIINAYNGIRFVQKFVECFPEFKIEFEYQLQSNEESVGQVDFLASDGQSFFIFDFKRSKGGGASFSQILKNEIIQLPYYLCQIERLRQMNCIGVGYVILSNLSESIFVRENINGISPIYFGSEKILNKEEWMNFKTNSAENLEWQVDKIKEGFSKKFFPESPRESTVCNYCPAKLYCRFEEVL